MEGEENMEISVDYGIGRVVGEVWALGHPDLNIHQKISAAMKAASLMEAKDRRDFCCGWFRGYNDVNNPIGGIDGQPGN